MPELTTKAAEHWVVSGRTDLPLAADVPWDGAGAKARLFDMAGFNSATPNPGKLAGAFLIHDASKPLDKGSYKYPIATVRQGKLVAVPAGIRAAKSRAAQEMSGVLLARMNALCDGYLSKMQADAASEKAWADSNLLVVTGGAVKALGSNTYGGYLYTFTTRKQRDLTHEYFDADTDFMLGVYPIQGIKALYNHGFDPSIHSIPLGQIVAVRPDSKGIYVEEKVNFLDNFKAYLGGLKQPRAWKQEQEDYAASYEQMLEEMLKNGELNWSGGAHPPSVRKSADGHIDRWATQEGSNTRTPAMPFTNRITPVKSLTFTPLDTRLSDAALKEHEHAHAEEANVDTEARHGETNAVSYWIVQQYPRSDREVTPMKVNSDELTRQAQTVAAQFVPEFNAQKDAPALDAKTFAVEIANAVKAAPMPADAPAGEADCEGEDCGDEMSAEKMLDAIWDAAGDLAAQYVAQAESRKNRVKSMATGALEAGKAAAVEYHRPGASKVGGFSADTQHNGDGTVKNVHFNRLDQSKYKPSLLSAIKAQMGHTLGKEADNYRDGGALKALNPYAGAVGGYLLNNELREGILPPLRSSVIAFKLGVKQTMMEGTGSLTVAKMTVAPTAFRPGINTEITASTPTFQTITAFPKPIASEVIIPRQQLLSGLASVEDDIRAQMILSIQLQIDSEIFVGTGNVVSPDTGAGIRGILQTATTQTTLATDGRQAQFADLIGQQTAIRAQNVPFDTSMGYALNPTQLGSLYSQTDTTGQPLMRMNNSTGNYDNLVGYPQQWSTQIPTNVTTGASTDTSYIFFGRWDMGEYFMLNDVAILVDEVTLMQNLQVRLIAYTFSDFIVHYNEAFAVLKGVRA